MRLSIAVLIFSIALIGCSSSYIVSSTPHDDELSFSKLNAETKNKSATIVFQDDSKLDCQEVLSALDSTSWLEPTTGARAAVPTFKIKKIFFKNRIVGTLDGGGIGLLAGGGVGFLIGSVLESPNSEWKGFVTLYFSVIGGGVGLLVGTVSGVIKGHTYEYKFENKSEKP